MPWTRKIYAEGPCANCGEPAVSYRPTAHPLYCMKPECRAIKFREKNKLNAAKRAEKQDYVVVNGVAIHREPMKLLDKQPRIRKCGSQFAKQWSECCDPACVERIKLGIPLLCERLSEDDLTIIDNHPQREHVVELLRKQGMEIA